MWSWYRSQAATAGAIPDGKSRKAAATTASRPETAVSWLGVTAGTWFRSHRDTRTEILGITNRMRTPARNGSRLARTLTSSRL